MVTTKVLRRRTKEEDSNVRTKLVETWSCVAILIVWLWQNKRLLLPWLLLALFVSISRSPYQAGSMPSGQETPASPLASFKGS